MNLFFVPDISGDSTVFSDDESRHALQVLRMRVGDELLLTDGLGTMCRCVISDCSSRMVTVNIVERMVDYQKRPYELWVAVAPTKNIDRYEWFLEKATEFGIDRITPLLCEHSERKVVKRDRSEKIVAGAVKQSQKAYMPMIDELTNLNDFINSIPQGYERYIAHCDEADQKRELKEMLTPASRYVVLIGPEGDFSDREVEMAHKAGFRSVSLGSARLRTETAAVYAAALAAIKN